MSFLQSFILPVCTFDVGGSVASFRRFFGTAFLLKDGEACLTARHVLEDAQSHAQSYDQVVGLIGKANGGTSRENTYIPLIEYELAPNPFDVVFLKVDYRAPCKFQIGTSQVVGWHDVATLGYADNAKSISGSYTHMNLRAQKGYVQRELLPGDVPHGDHPAGFELSFLISRGMSGAPLFLLNGSQSEVVGICVGSVRSETIHDSSLKVEENGETYRETTLKVEEYGHAHDLRSLAQWKP